MKTLSSIIALSLGLFVLGNCAYVRKNFDVETDFETILDITRNADGTYLIFIDFPSIF